MAKFCRYCGKPLAEGEICICNGQQAQGQQNQQPQTEGAENAAFSFPQKDAEGIWESVRKHMGIGENESNDFSPYEEGKKIIPDIVSPNEGEVPIRQYRVATLKNKTFGITYAKAAGRIQVTNKRVIFRAPGKSIVGMKTSLQHEFLIDEIGGIEARREHIFNKGDLSLGILLALLGFLAMGAILAAAVSGSNGSGFAFYFLSLVFGAAGMIPFFALKKKWLLKMMCAGGSAGAFALPVLLVRNGFFLLLLLLSLAVVFAAGFFCSIRPNLVLSIKPKGATNAVIEIRRTSHGAGAILQRSRWGDMDDHTGFHEIFPEEDAEKAIREIGAVINDIQKMGDYAISKWQEQR